MTTAVGIIPTTDFVVSATQVSAFELCPRKWAFRYIDGVESPPNKYADLGIDTHGHLEDWLREGKVPEGQDKSVQLAQALIPLLPPPQSVDPQNVELDQYYSLCGVTFNLKVDLFMPKWGQNPRVFDHKTCGDFRWALTPERLPGDIQGSLYGGWALHKMVTESVDLQWNYVVTKGAIKTLPVVATVRGRDIQERLGRSLESARKMRVIAESGARAMQVQYDPRGCSAFGGCPHQATCNLGAQERMTSIVAQAAAAATKGSNMSSTEDFLASLAQGKANGQQPMQTAAAQSVQAPLDFTTQPQAYVQAPMIQSAPLQPAQALMPQPTQTVQAPLIQPQPAQAPLVPQAAQTVQVPMMLQPAQAPLVPQPAQTVLQQAAPQTEAKAGPGRPAKVKAGDDPWVYFASAALGSFVTMQVRPEQAAPLAAQYADHLVQEYQRRK